MFRLFIASAIVCAAAGMGAVTASADSAYPNCDAAARDGRYDIPSDDPMYGPHLDRDQDGVGCES